MRLKQNHEWQTAWKLNVTEVEKLNVVKAAVENTRKLFVTWVEKLNVVKAAGGEEEEALRYRGREAQRRQGSGGEEDEALRHWAPPTHLLKDLLAAMPSSLVV